MAHNIFHTGFEFIEDKTSDLVDSAKKFGTDLYVDYKVNQMVDSFKDEFKGPTTITPEMAAEGWKPGLDGIPYNSKLNEKFEPGGIFYDPDVDKNTAIANAVASGEVSSAEAGTTPFELSQDLRQRTPSGTIYNPSMDAYNESSLFNYEGPGGVPEYTYGQGLRTGGAGYGTPPGPNLYYEGQYGEGFVEPGVADTAITLPPITMPAGVPQVPTSNTNTNTSNNTNNNDVNNNNGTNNYSSGMDSGLLNSYINETGIGTATQGSGMGYTGGVNEPGIGNATQGSGMGYSSGANEAGIGNATQGSGMGYSSGANEAGIAGTQQFMPSGMTLPADESGIGNTQQFMPSGMTMPADESGIGNTQQQLPPNTVTNPFEDSMSIPSLVRPVDSGTANSMSYLSNNFPANYANGNNMNLLTAADEEEDRLIMSAPMTVEEQAMGTNPGLFENSIMLNMSDMYTPTNENNDMSGYTFGGSTDNPGFDELIMSGVNAVQSLFDSDSPSAEEVAESVTKEPSIWSSVMETIAGTAGMGFPANIEPVNTEETLIQNPPDNSPAFTDNMFEYEGSYDNASGSNAAIDAIIAQNQGGIFNPPPPVIYNTPPVGPPSVISAPPPRPTSRPVVATNPVTSKPFVSYGPPNMRR